MSEPKLLCGDCLELMRKIDSRTVDMIFCDLPFGLTACKWDCEISLDGLWEQYKRIIKQNGIILLNASQPFSSKIVSSNYDWFRFEWIYQKRVASNFAQAKRQPLKTHESIMVFSPSSRYTYNPIMEQRVGSGEARLKYGYKSNPITGEFNGSIKSNRTTVSYEQLKHPSSVQEFNNRSAGDRGLHPTQKPVALCEYMVITHSNEGDLVLDNCMGSGTTGVACVRNGRGFIGIEKELIYFDIATKRIAKEGKQNE